jgi:hypothetical protein
VDGWVSRRAHFLLRSRAAAAILILHGTVERGQPLRLRLVAEGVRLPEKCVKERGDFEVTWPLPAGLGDREFVDVRLDCRPTFREARLLRIGRRHWKGFQVKAIRLA